MNNVPRCAPLIEGTEQARYDDYRYKGLETEREKAWDGYKCKTPQGRKNAERLIIKSAAEMDQLFVVVDQLEIEEGYRCTKCRETGKHTRQCEPPRGLCPA